MPNQEQWDKHWLKIAKVTSELSKDPSTKVGSVIVTPDNRHCSIGYNGFCRGIAETSEKWERPRKYSYVIHSEINALLNCPFDTVGCTLYCTHQCCHKCIAQIVQSGIVRVIYAQPYKNIECLDIWEEHKNLLKEIKQLDI